MQEEINKILNNINGYPLDANQKKVVLEENKYVLVSAGAGSGKSLTIIGKIRYLIEIKNIKEKEIICISFTNDATNNLKENIKKNYNYDIPCYTFHKLGIEILKDQNYQITKEDTLSYIINEFFETIIFNKKLLKITTKLLSNKKIIINKKKEYKQIDKIKIENTKKLINKFINLFKSNNHQNKDFIDFIKKSNKKEKKLLTIIFYIYYEYQKELESTKSLDFNDMISKSTTYIKNNNYNRSIKYIIIDEFQDTSKVRFELIKSLLTKTNAKLLVVGDDFQSIYRFTGCDLKIFLEFNKIFKDSKILKIENTYRNSQELINIAGSFIMKNKNQLKKNLKSQKKEQYPINIIYYKNLSITITKLINKIHIETKKPILILGRNNFDINELLKNKNFKKEKDDIIYIKNKNIKIKYLTVHRSKGLEEENVIIINLLNNKLGFPNKTENEKILRHVSCKEDEYPFAEERRLFYVAITRTKNKNYLLTKKDNESIFITELKKDYKEKIKILKI